ncbi:MAG: DUF502 domain-containing protein, partial [Chlamydiia bacterium]|nr:DUF502 domain-containing protein [Chlamydiia bacterium]
AVTIGIVIFIVNFLTQPFLGIVDSLFPNWRDTQGTLLFLSYKQIYHYGAQLAILLLLIMFTMLLGFITRWIFFKYLLSLGDYLLHRIPLINTIYKTTQDVIQTIFASQTQSFKQVVMVPFPEEGVYCLGLVTRAAPQMCSDIKQRELVSVFVPTTPNPTSGYLLMYSKKDITYLDMKVEDAIKFIISCGVIHPGSDDGDNSLAALIRKSHRMTETQDCD